MLGGRKSDGSILKSQSPSTRKSMGGGTQANAKKKTIEKRPASSLLSNDTGLGEEVTDKRLASAVGRKSTINKEKRSSSALDEDKDNRIRVVVRARPLNSMEREQKNKIIWRFVDGKVVELDDDGLKPSGKTYDYDCVFGPDSTNQGIYEGKCQQIILKTVQGFNGTIFAYGQTSSGKTHTMMGDPIKEPGINPLAIANIFNYISEHRDSAEWEVFVAYMEIYNENITDLLQPDPKLGFGMRVIEDKILGPNVKDLTEKSAMSPQHCLDLFLEGERRRSFAKTDMNAHSSRSHTLFRMRVESHSCANADQQDDIVEGMKTVAGEFIDTQTKLAAQNASLYLVDREHNELYIHAGDITLRLPMSQGIAGAVATTGQAINIPDAYRDSRFDQSVDKKTGFRTKSILCMAIKDEQQQVLGVVQLINKKNGGPFVADDERCCEELTLRIAPAISRAQACARTSTMGRLNLVDLAGSERQEKTNATGATLKEAANINTSLMMLGRCINMLSEGKQQHIPFRDSKLTLLLSTSLGGNANTCVICAFSPASRNRAETVSTLQFGSRCKTIINCAKVNKRTDQSEIVEAYQEEIAKLKQMLKQQGDQMAPQMFGGGSGGSEQMLSRRVASTQLTEDVLAGAECLPVASIEGFAIGDVILVGDERHTVKAFGSILIGSPLQRGHPAGTVVQVLNSGMRLNVQGHPGFSDLGVNLGGEMVAKLKQLEGDAAETEALANASTPPGMEPVRIRTMIAVSTTGDCLDSPAVVIAAMRGPGGGEVEWMTEKELHLRLAWLRRRGNAQSDAPAVAAAAPVEVVKRDSYTSLPAFQAAQRRHSNEKLAAATAAPVTRELSRDISPPYALQRHDQPRGSNDASNSVLGDSSRYFGQRDLSQGSAPEQAYVDSKLKEQEREIRRLKERLNEKEEAATLRTMLEARERELVTAHKVLATLTHPGHQHLATSSQVHNGVRSPAKSPTMSPALSPGLGGAVSMPLLLPRSFDTNHDGVTENASFQHLHSASRSLAMSPSRSPVMSPMSGLGGGLGNVPMFMPRYDQQHLFDTIDTNHDGVLSRSEYEAAVRAGLVPPSLQDVSSPHVTMRHTAVSTRTISVTPPFSRGRERSVSASPGPQSRQQSKVVPCATAWPVVM